MATKKQTRNKFQGKSKSIFAAFVCICLSAFVVYWYIYSYADAETIQTVLTTDTDANVVIQKNIDSLNTVDLTTVDENNEPIPADTGTEAEGSSGEESVVSKLLNFVYPAQQVNAASCGTIKGSFSTGKRGAYTVLKKSGAADQKQYSSPWANTKYGKAKNCSVYKAAGCAPSSIANALSAFKKFTPLQIGTKISDKYPKYRDNYKDSDACNSGTNQGAITAIINGQQAPDGYYIQATKVSWSSAKAAIDKNQPVIFKTTSPCFTTGGHYLTIKGKVKRKSDDKVFYWISDSGGKNITRATETTITTGAGGFWKVYKTYHPTVKLGSTGAPVKELQNHLNTLGYGTLKVDGSFGPATNSAAKKFQKNNGLTADGVVGSTTWAKIETKIAARSRYLE